MSNARSLLVVALLAAVGCGGSCGETDRPSTEAPATPESTPSEPAGGVRAALDYLATTEDELGLDVVLATRIHGQLRSDPYALRVANERRRDLDPGEVERYGLLLDAPLPTFPPASLEGVDPGPVPPDPVRDTGDERVQRCPVEVLECRVDEACADWVRLDDRGGYELTHQALWLLFAHWAACRTGVDLDARRLRIAARLLTEARADPGPHELQAERLAMLGHLGFASEIAPEQLDALWGLQRESGCLAVRPAGPCHPHPTGVVLWALAFAPPP